MIPRALAALLLYPLYVALVLLIACFYGDLRGRMSRMTLQLVEAVRIGVASGMRDNAGIHRAAEGRPVE